MNKRECIEYIYEQLIKAWEEHPAPTDYLKRREVYEHCKDVCKANGYVGEGFVQLWNRAVDKQARMMNVHP